MDNSTLESRDVLALTRTFNAPLDTVWRAWTEAEFLARWWGPKGCSCPGAKIDLRVGGRFELPIDTPDGSQPVAIGEYLEIVPYKRLRMTWAWQQSLKQGKPTQEVTIDFSASGDRTTINLVHAGCTDPVEFQNVTRGWQSSVQCREEVLIIETS